MQIHTKADRGGRFGVLRPGFANNMLTITDITRESLRLLHQNLNLVGNIVHEYDDSFAQEGAKIGNTLRIRLPMQYATGTGPTMTTGTGADSLQNQVTLTVNSQRHVPMRFTSNEMTMKLDDFSERHLRPAMAKLAAMIENDCFNMVAQVNNQVAGGTAVDFADIMSAKVKLDNFLAPEEDRVALLDPQGNADLVNTLKTLFEDRGQISRQYRKGMMGESAGFQFYQNTLLPNHTSGAEGGGTAYKVNGATEIGSYTAPNTSSLTVKSGTKTCLKGDVFTIAGVNRCHPESKADTGEAMQFTLLANRTGAGAASISPAIIPTGPYQNVTATPADSAKLTFVGAASTAYKQSLLFQKGFACFGSADLVLPKGVHMAAREVFDGISMRIVQNYDIVKDRVYTRLDVLYGYKILRPWLACKLQHT